MSDEVGLVRRNLSYLSDGAHKAVINEVLVVQAVTLMSHGCQDKRPNRAALIVWKVRLAMLPVVA